MSEARLLEEFAPASYEAWKAEAEKLLKGAPFEKKMFTPTPEGITLGPIYRREDLAGLDHLGSLPGEKPFVRGGSAGGYLRRPWRVCQRLPAASIAEWNAAAKQDLERGQTELPLTVASEPPRYTPRVAKLAELEAALEGIDPASVPLFFLPSPDGLLSVALVLAWAETANLEPGKFQGCLGLDPLGQAAQSGAFPESWKEDVAELMRRILDKFPRVKPLVVDASFVPDAGGSAVQELGYALAAGAAYFRALSDAGLPAGEIPGRFRQMFGIGPNFFMEIAKFRAARFLWTRLLEAFEMPVTGVAFDFHARTSRWNKTWIDAHTNLLRGTTEAFSAVLGGVQGLDVEPYDFPRRCPDAVSRRVARNIQIILAEECELARVVDPAGGSWFVEWLTARIAGEAWTFFQEIEKQGGVVAAIESGWLQAQIRQTASGRAEDVSKRRATLTGVNNYPNPQEPLPALETSRAVAMRPQGLRFKAGNLAEAIGAFRQGADLAEVAVVRGEERGKKSFPPVEARQGAGAYECLRLRCAALPEVPVVLQVNLGPSRDYRARADWTAAFFRVGGLQVRAERDFTSAVEAAAAVGEVRPALAVLVGTDARYQEEAVSAAQELKKALGGRLLILAGAPGELEAAWRGAGIDDFVHVRVDNGRFLEQLVDRLEKQA